MTDLPDRLRRGDAAALLELANATHGRALAVARAAGWSEDPEALLLDAYVALYFRRAAVPAHGLDAWALAEVVAYCESRSAAWRATAPGRAAAAVRRAARRALARFAATLAARPLAAPSAPAVGGSAS